MFIYNFLKTSKNFPNFLTTFAFTSLWGYGTSSTFERQLSRKMIFPGITSSSLGFYTSTFYSSSTTFFSSLFFIFVAWSLNSFLLVSVTTFTCPLGFHSASLSRVPSCLEFNMFTIWPICISKFFSEFPWLCMVSSLFLSVAFVFIMHWEVFMVN